MTWLSFFQCVSNTGEISLSYRKPSHILMQIALGFTLASCPWWHWSLLHKIAHFFQQLTWETWFLVDNPFNNIGFGDLHLFFNKLIGQLALPYPRVSFPDWSSSTFLIESAWKLSEKTRGFEIEAQALMV